MLRHRKRPTVLPARASYGTACASRHPDVGEADREHPETGSRTVGVDRADAGGPRTGVNGGRESRLISGGPLPSLLRMGFSTCGRPMRRSASPLAGKTINRRAGCGRSARPVRREGGATPIASPYPYQGSKFRRLPPAGACPRAGRRPDPRAGAGTGPPPRTAGPRGRSGIAGATSRLLMHFA